MSNLLVDERVGIVTRLQEQKREAGSPSMITVVGETCNIYPLTNQYAGKPAQVAGTSVDRTMAVRKALGEAVERYCAGQYSEDHMQVTSFAKSTVPCVPPKRFALYSLEQYYSRDCPYKPFTESVTVRWTPAFDPVTGETAYVPASMVYLPYAPCTETGEVCIGQQISTGLACHTDPASAALSAVCEVIERDVLSISWQAQMTGFELRLATLSEPNQDLVKRLQIPGVRVTLHYFPMDHGVPTILAMMRSSIHQAPALVVGAATHLDPERAVQKSLEELAQTWTLSQWLKRTRRTFTPGKLWENVVDPKSHARLYCDHSKLKHSLFFFMEARSIDFESIPNRSMGEPAHDFRIVIQMLKQIGYQVLLADVTTEDVRELGLVVLRAVIPGFHPLFMGHRWRALGGERLWSVPQRLGYRGITQDKGDNSSPHPFA